MNILSPKFENEATAIPLALDGGQFTDVKEITPFI